LKFSGITTFDLSHRIDVSTLAGGLVSYLDLAQSLGERRSVIELSRDREFAVGFDVPELPADLNQPQAAAESSCQLVASRNNQLTFAIDVSPFASRALADADRCQPFLEPLGLIELRLDCQLDRGSLTCLRKDGGAREGQEGHSNDGPAQGAWHSDPP
jgi:hypothetical protein